MDDQILRVFLGALFAGWWLSILMTGRKEIPSSKNNNTHGGLSWRKLLYGAPKARNIRSPDNQCALLSSDCAHMFDSLIFPCDCFFSNMRMARPLDLCSVHQLNSVFLHRGLAFSAARYWKRVENERFYVPGEDGFARVWHAFTYDVRRWSRRIDEVMIFFGLCICILCGVSISPIDFRHAGTPSNVDIRLPMPRKKPRITNCFHFVLTFLWSAVGYRVLLLLTGWNKDFATRTWE